MRTRRPPRTPAAHAHAVSASALTAGGGEPRAAPATPADPSAPTTPSGPTTPSAPRRVADRRYAAVIVIAVLAVLFAMREAREFLIPLVLAILLSYALEPLVYTLVRRVRIPRPISAAVVMAALVGALVFGVTSLQNQVGTIVDSLPQTVQKVTRTVQGFAAGKGSFLDKLRAAGAALDKGEKPRAQGAAVAARPSEKLEGMLLAGSMGVASGMGQGVMVLFLVFFLLCSGDIFKRKFIKVCGHTISEKKINVHMLDQINRSIRLYMAMMVITNILLALCSWAAFRLLGLDNAGTWAVVAGALHVVPYFGPLLVAVFTGVAAVVQFGELGPALLVAGVSLLIASLIGFVVQTWMTGRIARMNPVAVFVMLLLFTWVWGLWGTLLSVPIAVIVKVVADHVDDLHAVAEFLGE
ncbi:AI-2E family transporter [Achromobacter aloeverae]|uniref:AI-2E family transporter n=1 Tax=Achromobacter aloeverae TaxID=1750518 RepID=A0A4Q1HQA6_9BURK|nr:AI-2E family transporter [Achromobacter aloeverae]RXN93248.1 AI-2E family transporter [Achromobacter aloeverae]